MSRSLRNGLWGLTLGFVVLFASANEARAQKAIGEVLRRLDAHHRALTSVRAAITLTTYNAGLKKTDALKGVMSYLPGTPDKKLSMRLDWLTPSKEQSLVMGDDFERYRPKSNQVVFGKVGDLKKEPTISGPYGFIGLSAPQVKANYDVVCLSEEIITGGRKTWRLELRPFKRTDKRSIQLWVDVDGMPRQTRFTEQNGDSTTVLIDDVLKNLEVRNDVFRLRYPRSVKKIRV